MLSRKWRFLRAKTASEIEATMNELGMKKWAVYGFEVKYIEGEPVIVVLMHTATVEMEFKVEMFDGIGDAESTLNDLSANNWALLDFKINDLDNCLQVLVVGYRPIAGKLPSGAKVIIR